MITLKKYRVIASYLVVILLIFLPLAKLGYILSVDITWGKQLLISTSSSNIWPLSELLNFLNNTFPSMLFEKLFLFCVILLAAFGAYYLNDLKKLNVGIYAGLLYLFNPFLYTRFLMGQWLVLLGYALLPWAIAATWRFLEKPNAKHMLRLGLWSAAVGLTSIHTVGILALAMVALFIAHGRKNFKSKLLWGGGAFLIWVALNATWLIPAITGSSSTAQNIASFDSSQLQAFATQPTVLHSVPLSAALLNGFWSDPLNRYILPSATPIFYVGAVIIATLVITGAAVSVRRRDRLGIALGVAGFIAWLLGMGIAWGGSAWLTRLLIDVVPFYSGYREPQKWLMLLALAYAYFAAVGAAWLAERYKQHAKIILAVALIAPFLYTPTLLWGAAGQLKASQYPTGWQQADTSLQAAGANKDTMVLVLPWHQYLPLSFVGRVVANPTPNYFPYHMVTGNNPEIRGVGTTNDTPLTMYVNNRLVPLTSEHQADIGGKLASYDVQYVMLLKEADWRQYDWLNSAKGLTIYQSSDSIILYRVVQK